MIINKKNKLSPKQASCSIKSRRNKTKHISYLLNLKLFMFLISIITLFVSVFSLSTASAIDDSVPKTTFETIPQIGTSPEATVVFPTTEESKKYINTLAVMAYNDGINNRKKLTQYTGPTQVKTTIENIIAERERKEAEARRLAELRRQEAIRRANAQRQGTSSRTQVSSAQSASPRTFPGTNIPVGAQNFWSRDRVRAELAEAADYYNVTGADREWIINTGLRIALGESTFDEYNQNGQYLGLFQFGERWAPAKYRLDGEWSCRRFVRVFTVQGVAGIKRHWKATF